PAGQLLDERVVAGLLDELGHAGHGPLEIPHLPVRRARRPMEHLRGPVGIHVQLEDGRALGAEGPLVVRAARIAFDVDDLAVDGVNQRGAPDRAIRTDARRDLGVLDSKLLGLRHDGPEVDPGACQARERHASTGANRYSEKVTPGDIHEIPSSLTLTAEVARDWNTVPAMS